STPAPGTPGTTPAQSEPAGSEPAASEPAESEPAESEPAESEPAESEPAESEPAESEPAESEPAESEPAESEPPTGGEPVMGGTLAFGGAALAASLDPAQTSDGESFRILQQIYEPLVDLAPGTVDELVGVLAESWTGEPSDTEYVFNLRQGVTFHDGTPLNAEAVKANFDRWQSFSEEFQATAYYYGAVMDGFGPDNLITSVEATDENTVTVTLREPSPTFLFGIALTPFSIVSPAILESTNASDFTANTLGTEVVQGGTGPFMLEAYVPGEQATLVRNEEYHGDRTAYLERLIILPYADPAARLQALQAGTIQGLDLIAPADRAAVDGVEGFQLVNRESYNTLYLGVNPTASEDSPLADQAVRQAVSHAIDREGLIAAFYGGGGSPADIFLPPTSGWFDSVGEGVEVYDYDPEGARALLEGAGFGPDNPPTVNFWFPTEVTRPYMPDPAGLHQAVTTMLEEVGFQVTPGSAIWGTEYIPAAQNGEYDLHFLGWTGDFDDPSNWYGVHFGYSQGEPGAQFGCDPEGLEAAIDEADAALDETERGVAWNEVASIVHSEVCFATLVHGDTGIALNDQVQNYVANPTGSESFYDIWLSGE
ncbi:MAG: ABC transporter substrate-binding protein, partial [Chloroflexota bacterium]|nr:ABC transporter substrate-binding protein [Chloroflexota bacterium]